MDYLGLGERILLKRIVCGIMLMLILGSIFFSAIMLVRSDIVEHDLVVFWNEPIVNERNHLRNGTSTVLNMTVFNNGSSVEDVILQLLINGTYVLNSSMPNLAPGHVFWSTYFWVPEEGDYYLTAYAPPVENETHTANNNDTKWVRVCPDKSPIASFTFEPEIEPNIIFVDKNVTFDASASNDDLDWGTIVRYEWDWNDTTTNTTTEPIINHIFHEPRTYNVTLVVVDNNGNDSLPAWRLVAAEKKPVASFTVRESHEYGEGPPPYYVNDTLTFDASSSEPDGGHIVWYLWDFNDTTPPENTTLPQTLHSYTFPGTYNVTLIIADNNTLTDSYSKWVNIAIGFPVANFTVQYPSSPPYYVGEPLRFDASASHDSDWGYIDVYHWDFGDLTSVVNETDPIAYHSYMAEGEYTVTLTVTDNSNLTSSPVNITLSVSSRVYLKVEPQTVETNPGEKTLNINITIANVTDLESFEFKLSWPPDWLPHSTSPILLGKPIDIIEGSFLGNQFGPEGMRWNCKNDEDVGEGYILVNCTFFTDIVPTEERTGSGTLANIILSVETSGNSTLDLTEIKLLNSDGENIPHEVEYGYFYTTRPVANFAYSPPAVPNQAETFDASSSYDPDNLYDLTPGPIVNYLWDWDDTTTNTTTEPIINHTFTSGVFRVNLTVTDDDGETWWIIYYVPTVNVTLDVKPCQGAFNETAGLYETAGRLPINVTVTNNGEFTETFTVTVYANDTTIGNRTVTIPAGGSENIDFSLDTSVFQKGNYSISAHAPGNITYADYLVGVYLTGDVDHNGAVNIYDVVKITGIYGSELGDPEFTYNTDLDCNGKIQIYDVVICTGHYGQEDP